MTYIIMGSISFLLFLLYDINSVKMKLRLIQGSFFIGFFLLIAATVGIAKTSFEQSPHSTFRIAVFGLIALFFLLLLLYTLFFAIPFGDTYIRTDSPPVTCRSGVYALSRHPGVLWFMGFYLFLWLSAGGNLLLIAGIIFSFFNLTYIIVQDRWTFMKTFVDYSDYRSTTPFLFPTHHSIRRCFITLHSGRR